MDPDSFDDTRARQAQPTSTLHNPHQNGQRQNRRHQHQSEHRPLSMPLYFDAAGPGLNLTGTSRQAPRRQPSTSTTVSHTSSSPSSSSPTAAIPSLSTLFVPPSPFAASTASTAATAAAKVAATAAKEQMVDNRILALSSLVETMASTSTRSCQGYYGKQLQLLGETVGDRGSDFTMLVKLCVLENGWMSCPLLPPTTLLHSWECTEYSKPKTPSAQQAACTERDTNTRPKSPSKQSMTDCPPEMHVAVLGSALCFVTHRAGDYSLCLKFRVSYTPSTLLDRFSQSIHLSLIPRCLRNHLWFKVNPHPSSASLHELSSDSVDSSHSSSNAMNTTLDQQHVVFDTRLFDAIEYRVFPELMQLDEALNPDSDEDAEFWLRVQEEQQKRRARPSPSAKDPTCNGSKEGEMTPKAVSQLHAAKDSTLISSVDGTSLIDDSTAKNQRETSGCFTPASTLHISWMSSQESVFVHPIVSQKVNYKIMAASLTLQEARNAQLPSKRLKSPEGEPPLETLEVLDDSERDEAMDVLEQQSESDEADKDRYMMATMESVLSVQVMKIGWRQPFVDFKTVHQRMNQSDNVDQQQESLSVIDVTGDVVQGWELLDIHPSEDGYESDPRDEHATIYRVFLHAGFAGPTQIKVQVGVERQRTHHSERPVSFWLPRVAVLGAVNDFGEVRVETECKETFLQEEHNYGLELIHERSMGDGLPLVLNYRYRAQGYQLFVQSRRQILTLGLARVERMQVELGVSDGRVFARARLSNIVLPRFDTFLRIHQLEKTQIWSLSLDGVPCSINEAHDAMDPRKRVVLVNIPSTVASRKPSVELVYSFTLPELQEQTLAEHNSINIVSLILPSVDLVVGEYKVVATLPTISKAQTELEYANPIGIFEPMHDYASQSLLPRQAGTYSYASYMVQGSQRVQLDIPIQPFAAARVAGENVGREQSRTMMAQIGSVQHSHDPQQQSRPPLQLSRHPQLPPQDLQSPQLNRDSRIFVDQSNVEARQEADKGLCFGLREADGHAEGPLTFAQLTDERSVTGAVLKNRATATAYSTGLTRRRAAEQAVMENNDSINTGSIDFGVKNIHCHGCAKGEVKVEGERHACAEGDINSTPFDNGHSSGDSRGTRNINSDRNNSARAIAATRTRAWLWITGIATLTVLSVWVLLNAAAYVRPETHDLVLFGPFAMRRLGVEVDDGSRTDGSLFSFFGLGAAPSPPPLEAVDASRVPTSNANISPDQEKQERTEARVLTQTKKESAAASKVTAHTKDGKGDTEGMNRGGSTDAERLRYEVGVKDGVADEVNSRGNEPAQPSQQGPVGWMKLWSLLQELLADVYTKTTSISVREQEQANGGETSLG